MRGARLPVQKSAPLTLQHETGPIIRIVPAFGLRNTNLRRLQSLGRTFPVSKHLFIELSHQCSRRSVVHFPETRDHAHSTRIHETARECDQTLPADLFAD